MSAFLVVLVSTLTLLVQLPSVLHADLVHMQMQHVLSNALLVPKELPVRVTGVKNANNAILDRIRTQ